LIGEYPAKRALFAVVAAPSWRRNTAEGALLAVNFTIGAT
jgi:hypothetical protein